MKYLNNIIEKFNSRKVILTGCNDQEIQEVITSAGGFLPACYIEFLETMGKDVEENYNKPDYYEYGNFKGENIFYSTVIILNEDKNALLQEDNRGDLNHSSNDFIFFDSQGYLYAFFKLNEGDNPPVYGYQEGYKGMDFPKIADSLSEFYENYLEGKIEFPK